MSVVYVYDAHLRLLAERSGFTLESLLLGFNGGFCCMQCTLS